MQTWIRWSRRACRNWNVVDGSVCLVDSPRFGEIMWSITSRQNTSIVVGFNAATVTQSVQRGKRLPCISCGDIKILKTNKRISCYLGLDDLIGQNMQKGASGMWLCLQCDFNSSRRCNVQSHVEAKHVISEGVQCGVCGTTCPTRKALSMHFSRKHRVLWIKKGLLFFTMIVVEWCNAGLDGLIEQCLERNPDGLWQCLYCQFSSVHKHHVKNHCEAKHISSGGVVCLNCGVTCPTRKALAMHMSRKHKQYD